MKTVQKEVFWRKPNPEGKGKIRESLGFAESKHFETIDEAVEVIGESRLLERLNSQLLTDAMNEFRAEKRPGGTMGKTALRNKAVERLTSEEMTTALTEAAAKGILPGQAIEQLIASKIDEIKAELGIVDNDDED
jgi:hypothetical protein